MCGILGIAYRSDMLVSISEEFESALKRRFESALQTLSNRGPDDSGYEVFFDLGVFLGHTRLAIQDLSSAGSQPMFSCNKNLVISFNGEIYNFPELKKELEKLGYVFASNTDTEVLLYLYQEYGEKCFTMLDGIFALVILDKAKNVLVTARDALGIKPFYYYKDDHCFIFSSEIKAIELLITDQRLSIDKKSINRYLTFQYCPGEGTPFNEVRKHNPGESFRIIRGEIVSRSSFFKLPIHKSVKKLDKAPVKKIVVELECNLRKAVHDQMLSDTPVGAFLSGGLDSTSIVAFAREVDSSIPCFTIDSKNSSNDGMADDLPYAIAAAKFLNVPLEVVRVDSESLIKNLEKMVWILDEPLGDTAPLNVLYISELAKDNGINVLLSGAGGDDIFTGYRRHRAIMLDQKIQSIPNCLLSSLERITGKLDKRITLFRRLAKMFNGAGLSGDLRIINYFKWANQAQLCNLYSDDFKEELLNDAADQPMIDFLKGAHKNASNLDKMLSLEQRFFTTDHNLLYTDKMSMATGVEVRVPLLARHLVEYSAMIPDFLKQKGSVGKWIFKKTMESYLPKDIIYRPKTGFGTPLRYWITVELKDYVNDLLGSRSLLARGLFNPERVKHLIDQNMTGKVDASYTILSLLCIEIWCRQHIDYNVTPGS